MSAEKQGNGQNGHDKMDKKIEVGKSYDLAIKVWRRDVRVISETENSIKVCSNYRLKGDENWKPIYAHISKKSVLEIKELQK